MELVYSNDKTKQQCTSMKAAKKLMGGSDILSEKPDGKNKCVKTGRKH